MKKFTVLIMAVLMVSLVLSGCGSSTDGSSPAGSTAPGDAGEAAGIKVAAVFGGPITDKSWNETAYNGLQKIKAMGAEVAYTESTPAADAPDAIRTFASSGYNVVYVNSSAFKDAAYEIAPQFPKVTFIINGVGKQGPNYASLTTANGQQGYLQGIITALVTKKNKVGMINGTEMTPTLDSEAGFYQAVAYVNEKKGRNVQPKVTYLGNYTDTTAGYETAKSFIAEGYDAMTTVADNASNAVLQACEEAGVLSVGNGFDQNKVAPKTMIAGITKDNEKTYVQSFKEYLDGTLLEKAATESYGINYGVVGLDGYFLPAADALTEDDKAFIKETMDKVASGEIIVKTMAEYKGQ
ncbi:MAG: basic rane lipoprotein [Paenibacillaceae bacterium]|jgi:basic membrane lipoprotein Med (substrate-binding protein (PBP1-ABC) superfamily)|nr:basic rane lipoprotein [Paenibacillaceae bacterium]